MRNRSSTLQSRLFFGFAAIIGAILAVAFAFFYAFFSVYCDETVAARQLNIGSSLSSSIDAEILKMNTVSMNIVYSNLVSEEFQDYLATTKDMDGSAEAVGKWKSAAAIFDLLWAIIGPFQTVSQVDIYSPGGAVIGTGIYNVEGKVDLGRTSWYARTMALGGSRYIGPPERMPSLELRNAALKSHQFLRLCRQFSSNRFEAEGIVEVLQDADSFFAPVEKARRLNEGVSIYVLDGEGRQFYPYADEGSADGAYYAAMVDSGALRLETTASLLARDRQEGLVATFSSSEYSDWKVLVVEPKAHAYLPLRRFNTILAVASALMLVLGWLATFIAAGRLSRPLKELQAALAGIDAVDFVGGEPAAPRISPSSIAEIDGLRASFASMYEELGKSTRQLVATRSEETKARMLALQSLMNPHFIYNNLAAIGAMADEGLCSEIKAMCEDVSFLLRYVSSTSESGVRLGDEIEHTERYLNCMKSRYGDSLSFEIAVPDAMRDIVVPKLVVQPLVENSIKHGFDRSPPWRLSLRGWTEEGLWRVEVADDGIGFEPESLAALREQIDRCLGSDSLPELGIEGMGLLNIVLRLKLLYGEAYFFAIDDRPETGARVTIGGRIDGR
jgi:two-component system, sensor histidine kinase YesM